MTARVSPLTQPQVLHHPLDNTILNITPHYALSHHGGAVTGQDVDELIAYESEYDVDLKSHRYESVALEGVLFSIWHDVTTESWYSVAGTCANV